MNLGDSPGTYDDREFAGILCGRLDKHLKSVYDLVDKIVCVSHFVPCIELLEFYSSPFLAILRAFMGSVKIGETILNPDYRDKISMVIYGHWHRKGERGLSGVGFHNVSMMEFSGELNTPTIIEVYTDSNKAVMNQ